MNETVSGTCNSDKTSTRNLDPQTQLCSADSWLEQLSAALVITAAGASSFALMCITVGEGSKHTMGNQEGRKLVQEVHQRQRQVSNSRHYGFLL